MIIEWIINFLFYIADIFIGFFPTISFNLPSFDTTRSISVFFRYLRWFFPLDLALVLIGIYYSFDIARLVVAVIVRIKSFIPGFGGD